MENKYQESRSFFSGGRGREGTLFSFLPRELIGEFEKFRQSCNYTVSIVPTPKGVDLIIQKEEKVFVFPFRNREGYADLKNEIPRLVDNIITRYSYSVLSFRDTVKYYPDADTIVFTTNISKKGHVPANPLGTVTTEYDLHGKVYGYIQTFKTPPCPELIAALLQIADMPLPR